MHKLSWELNCDVVQLRNNVYNITLVWRMWQLILKCSAWKAHRYIGLHALIQYICVCAHAHMHTDTPPPPHAHRYPTPTTYTHTHTNKLCLLLASVCFHHEGILVCTIFVIPFVLPKAYSSYSGYISGDGAVAQSSVFLFYQSVNHWKIWPRKKENIILQNQIWLLMPCMRHGNTLVCSSFLFSFL